MAVRNGGGPCKRAFLGKGMGQRFRTFWSSLVKPGRFQNGEDRGGHSFMIRAVDVRSGIHRWDLDLFGRTKKILEVRPNIRCLSGL